MQNNRQHIIIAIVAIIIALVFFLIFSGKNKINWEEHYRKGGTDPYGTFVVQNLLEKYFEEEEFTVLKDSINGVLPLEKNAGTYVFIGQAMFLDSADTQALLDFVEVGNKAFIAGKTIPFDLINYIYYDDCEDFYWDDYLNYQDTIARLDFRHDNFQTDTTFDFQYYKRGEAAHYSWSYFDAGIFCEEDYTFVPLGDIESSLTNFAKASYGEGEFYFHTTPLAFTNISLLEESGLEYATKVFSHLSKGDIYWDEYSRIPEAVSRLRNQSSYRTFESEGPLKYVLSQPSLAWAWYLLLATGLLYLIFRAKRRQRVIPVLEKNTNTSLEFIGTIGRLYFLQNNHRKLALQKMKLFLGYVRDRYHLQTKELDEQFVNQLVSRSEIPKTIIDKILLFHTNIENSQFVSENTLVDFHHEMEKFYKNCK